MSQLHLRLMILVVLSVTAFSTRTLPYSMSLFPFNNDGVTEARIAEDILSAEHLAYPEGSFYIGSHSTVTIAYNVMVAFASSGTDIDTYTISQALIAAVSILTVVGVYVITLGLSRSYTGAICAAFVLAFLGTFVFLTGSAWKGALGVALLVLLTFAYKNRCDRRYLALEFVVLAALPLTHHLVTVLACLMLAYLTSWSMFAAIHNRRISTQHIIDVAVLVAASTLGYLYYSTSSFSRLSDYGTMDSIANIFFIFLVLACGTTVVLFRKGSLKMSLAPVAGSVVATVVYLDYYDSVFPYTQGYKPAILMLGIIYGLVVAFGWSGLEWLCRSESRLRAIPIGLMLPVLSVLFYALTSGLDIEAHKMFYRTFDYADIALAMGAGVGVIHLAKGKYRHIAVIALTVALLCSFPFGYATATLLGDRHDTQEFEVDAITWVNDNAGSTTPLRSDERLAYNAQALYDFWKDPYLPSSLVSGILSSPDVMNLILEEWMVTGVNDYPRGHPVLDEDYVNLIISNSNVLYVGGPESNNLIVFQIANVN